MPRLSPTFLRQAWNINPLLPLLLRQCRSLSAAQNELRWLREHVHAHPHQHGVGPGAAESLLLKMCKKRARGKPLQYLLGSQPFGELEILCRPGVLIPRPETEIYAAHLADVIQGDEKFRSKKRLRVLDLCTGTGAIPLSLYELLRKKFDTMNVCGVDFSDAALQLAKKNLMHNQKILPDEARAEITFVKADVLKKDFLAALPSDEGGQWDIVVSNPPYISPRSYWKDTSRSARLFEPLSALVPLAAIPDFLNMEHLHQEDMFYSAIVETAMSASADFLLMEVADIEQAKRVVRHTHSRHHFKMVEIWRDWPMDAVVEEIVEDMKDSHRLRYKIRGSGNGRSVFCRF